jgi:nucleoside-diphosphate-sugar epimerase
VHERALVLFDSRSIRTFLHVDDAIRGYLLALDRAAQMTGQVFNVGTERMNLSKRQLAERIKEHLDFAIIDSDLADPDVRNFLIRFEKIAALDYRPEKSLADGIRELIALFRVYRPTTPYRII